MLDFYKNINEVSSSHKLLKQKIVKTNFNKWKRELSKKELRLIYASCSREMYELGYMKKRYNHKISNFTRAREIIISTIKYYLGLIKQKELFKPHLEDYLKKIENKRK